MSYKHFFFTIAFFVAIIFTLICVVNLENGDGYLLAAGAGAVACICLYLKVSSEADKDNQINGIK